MKVKTVMKIGIPLLAVSALAITLPVALTACSDSKKAENEFSTNLASGTTQVYNLGQDYTLSVKLSNNPENYEYQWFAQKTKAAKPSSVQKVNEKQDDSTSTKPELATPNQLSGFSKIENANTPNLTIKSDQLQQASGVKFACVAYLKTDASKYYVSNITTLAIAPQNNLQSSSITSFITNGSKTIFTKANLDNPKNYNKQTHEIVNGSPMFNSIVDGLGLNNTANSQSKLIALSDESTPVSEVQSMKLVWNKYSITDSNTSGKYNVSVQIHLKDGTTWNKSLYSTNEESKFFINESNDLVINNLATDYVNNDQIITQDQIINLVSQINTVNFVLANQLQYGITANSSSPNIEFNSAFVSSVSPKQSKDAPENHQINALQALGKSLSINSSSLDKIDVKFNQNDKVTSSGSYENSYNIPIEVQLTLKTGSFSDYDNQNLSGEYQIPHSDMKTQYKVNISQDKKTLTLIANMMGGNIAVPISEVTSNGDLKDAFTNEGLKFVVQKMIGASNIQIPNENGTKEYSITIENNKDHEKFFEALSTGINLPVGLIQNVTFDFAKQSGKVVPVTIGITLIHGTSLYGRDNFNNDTYKNVWVKKQFVNNGKNAQIQIIGIRLSNVNKTQQTTKESEHKKVEEKKPAKVVTGSKDTKKEPVTKVVAKSPIKEVPKTTTTKPTVQPVGKKSDKEVSKTETKAATKPGQKAKEKSTPKAVAPAPAKPSVAAQAKK